MDDRLQEFLEKSGIADSFILPVVLANLIVFAVFMISFFYVVKERRLLYFILSIIFPIVFPVYMVLAVIKFIRKNNPFKASKNKKGSFDPESVINIDNINEAYELLLDSGKKIYITNPFRGIFITGGAGAGKSRSIIEPLIYQSISKDFTGILYDYENPVLARHVWAAFRTSKCRVRDYYVNFSDLKKSHRLNPLKAEFMTSSSYAREYSTTILMNLMPETISRPKDFWTRSAESLFAAIIWYLRERHPKYCSLPHAVSIALNDDLDKVLEVISTEEECQGMVASIKGGLKSDNQTAGITATIQTALSGINSPEIFWVLSGGDLTLDLNNPNQPKFLTIGNEPTLVDTYSPVISLVLSAALKLMNQQGKQKSVLLVDELPTLYIPNLDRIPATARKNKIASILSIQDYSQLEDRYGEKKAEVITSVLSNQFFGNTKNPRTAERVSKLYGKQDQQFVTESQGSNKGRSTGGSLLGSSSTGTNYSRSTTIQERNRVKPQDLANLNKGQFYGSLVDVPDTEFKVQFLGEERQIKDIPDFKKVTQEEVKTNYKRVKSEALAILDKRSSDHDQENKMGITWELGS